MGKQMKVALVGAGVGGLSAAARLARHGFEVELYEKGSGPGGRCGRLSVDGFHFDTGPTLLLMPEVLEETFAAVGKKSADYLKLHRCDPNYRIQFWDSTDVTFSSELTHMSHEMERMEPGSFRRYLEFLALGRHQYTTSLDHFVGRNFDSFWPMLGPKTMKKVFEVKAHRQMYGEVSRFFKDERLRAALTFQTMYLGISPYESPAVYGLLPFTELAVGIWFPEGGMYALPLALEKVCKELGVRLHYRAGVKKILTEKGRTRGLELEDGSKVDADIVLCNSDLPWAYENLIDKSHTQLPRADSLKYTSSAFMMYLGMKKRCDTFLHHNVILGNDYEGSFKDIFERFKVPEDPSFYVNAPAHTDASLAPAGKDSLYVLVPVPQRDAKLDWKEEGKKLRAKVFAKLKALGHGELESNIEVERVFTPDDYEYKLNLAKGSAFGLSHNFFQIGPFRPKNQDPHVKNLFFVGASTQPGTGLPMVMLSAKLSAERVINYARSLGASVEPLHPSSEGGAREVAA